MAGLEEVLGESAAIAEVRAQAARLLASAAGASRRPPPILILGETGTGKGLLAAGVHRAGGRAAGPLVDVNCAAIPETLIEAELFGFERGAFTDARQAKAGLFQAATGGSIFLDEVGLLPLALQSKLLKVLEERSVRRLGSTRSEPLDVSVIAATSEDLPAAVREGRFRADLYHRLAVVTLVLPPLRARGRDVLLLARHFLERIAAEYGLPARRLTADAEAALLAYSWPGNVRELGNALERAALLSDGPEVTANALQLPAPASAEGADRETDAAERERGVLLETLRDAGWNFTRAAAQLGLPRNTLRYRVERLGLTPEGPPERRRGGRPPAPARSLPPPPERESPAPVPAAPELRRVTLLLVRPSAAPGFAAGRALEDSAGKVRSFGGRIEALGRGELLATFGLEPDEDAPRRAAYAAIAVLTMAARSRAGVADAPAVAAALHTAMLPVAGAGGTLGLPAGAATGARRELRELLAGAGPGHVVASAAVARFLARRFELTPLDSAGGAPAGACRVARGAAPARTRFVGRERELRLLLEGFELAAAGQGQVVMIAGEPGIGKSRLLREFRERLGRRATWVEGQALSFGRSMPLHPLIDMLRRVFRIDDADPEAVVVEKIAVGARRLGGDVGDTLPFLRYLLSVDPGDPAVLAMDPGRRHAAIVRATHLLLERGAALRPHVVALEDLHWCDPATEDWISRLADGIAAKRALVLLTYRPGYRPAFGSRSFHAMLALPTLSGEDSLRIAGGLLGADRLPAALEALVVDKAEGNPFFIEELVRSLTEVGAVARGGGEATLTAHLDRVAVPDTVEAVILARTHRLDDDLRHVLEVAAVIGKNVPFPVLRAVTGRAEEALAADLRRLEAAEFLYGVRVFPEVEHTFKHALTHDVAYGRVDPTLRRALHARIARAIEDLFRDRLGEHVERLAYHALRAEIWPEAVAYSRQAGVRAFDRSANREAVASFDQALAALAHLPAGEETLAQAIDIRLALRSALLQLAELARIRRDLGEAEALATALGDRRRLAWVWTYTTIAHLFAGEPGAALAVGERALALAEDVGDVGLRASARTPLAHACRERGDLRRAVGLFGEAIAALAGGLVRERLGQAMPPSFYARSMAAFCLAELGDFGEAARLGAEAVAHTRALDLPFGLALAHMALGHTAIVQGRLADATAALDSALDLIETRGLPTWFPWAAALRGHALVRVGRPAEGEALLERALERARVVGILVGHSQWVSWLAHARLAAGRLDEARRLGDEALRLSRERGERGYEAWALHGLGEVEARREPDGASAAEALHEQARALAVELGMRPLVARCHLALGRLPGASGAAAEHLRLARALFAQLAMPVEPDGGAAGR